MHRYVSPVFLALLVASFILWYIAKLSYTYTTEQTVRVSVDGQPFEVTCVVGAQVPVSADAATGIVAQQREDEYIHRMNLPFSAGVGRTSVAVEAALIANTDTIQVVLFYPIYVSCYYNQ